MASRSIRIFFFHLCVAGGGGGGGKMIHTRKMGKVLYIALPFIYKKKKKKKSGGGGEANVFF